MVNKVQRVVEIIRQSMEDKGASFGEATIFTPGDEFKLRITIEVILVDEGEEDENG